MTEETFNVDLPPGISQQAIHAIADILSGQGFDTTYSGALLLPHQYLDVPSGSVTLGCVKVTED